MISRRQLINNLAAGAAGVASASTARSYAQIVGANDHLNLAIAGVNGRGYAHLSALANNSKTARVTHACDVDSKILAKFLPAAEKELGYSVEGSGDFRKLLERKDIDVLTIATPDHWHAPMAILAVQAGKHVYVEKPSSHNPREGELLVQAQQKYNKMVQVGDQQRSSPHTISMIKKIHDGLIGNAYYAKAWYCNTRKSMGTGKPAAVPATLNWDLWQGPAPRSEYVDNVHPYNWHWLRRFGTGETLNNGTHEVDICRWALDVNYPDRITASGGRYAFQDDWQFYDTLNTSFEYPGKMITWETKCSNGMPFYGRDRGMTIHGTTGTVLMDRGGYEVFDLNGRKTDSFTTGKESSAKDAISRDSMTDAHFANLIDAIRTGARLNSPIPIANVSVTILQLSNIAYFMQRELKLDNKTGHILNDGEAMKLWARDYQKGWEVRV